MVHGRVGNRGREHAPTTFGCWMEMPTSDSRRVSTLRDSVALCVIALMATVLSRQEPATPGMVISLDMP